MELEDYLCANKDCGRIARSDDTDESAGGSCKRCRECEAQLAKLVRWLDDHEHEERVVELRVVERGPDRLVVTLHELPTPEAHPGRQVGIYRYYAGPADELEGDRAYAGGVAASFLGEDPR